MKRQTTRIFTGFRELDYMILEGFHPEDLIVIAGRPGVGKTTFAIGIVRHAALYCDIPALFFSLEMPREQLLHRMLSLGVMIDPPKLNTDFFEAKDWPCYTVHLAGRRSKPSVFIVDIPSISVTEIGHHAWHLKKKYGLGLVVVDYLQLIQDHTGVRHSSNQRISNFSNALKDMARELQVPVVVLSQLNRTQDRRQNKRPYISDLIGTGIDEQDADIIIFLYRDEGYNHREDYSHSAEIIIAKQRRGPTGMTKLVFGSKNLFAENPFQNLTSTW